MFVVLVIGSVLLALVLTASAGTKLMKAPQAVEGLDRAKVPHSWYPGLAALEWPAPPASSSASASPVWASLRRSE